MLTRGVNTEAPRATSSTETNTDHQPRTESSTNTGNAQYFDMSTEMTDTDEDTEFFDIDDDDDMDTSPAIADYDPRADQLRQEAEYELHHQETRHQQQLALARQQANTLLEEQQRAHRAEALRALIEQAERLTRQRDADVYRVLQAQAQKDHESRRQIPVPKSKAPAPPPSIKDEKNKD